MGIFSEMGLRDVINADGKMTILGTSTASETVSEAAKQALKSFVVIEDLMQHTGNVIAKKTGAEAGCPTCGAAAGIAISVAACIAGENLNAIESLPFFNGAKKEVIIQKGHVVNFGASVYQMITLGGGVPVEVGTANLVACENVSCAINENTAALIYIKSHHAVQKGMVSLDDYISIGKEHGIPVIVDAAAEEDFKKYIAAGADLVIYSGGKALCAPTSGFICGRKDLIKACHKQYKGIGRAMKVSKEAMAGLISALGEYGKNFVTKERQIELMTNVCNELNKVDGLSCRIMQDEAGREIYRAEIKVDASLTGISAYDINEKLKVGNPAIYLRAYNVNQNLLHIDPRPLFENQEKIIADSIKKIIEESK